MKISISRIVPGMFKGLVLLAAGIAGGLSASSSADAAVLSQGSLCFPAYGTPHGDVDRINGWTVSRNARIMVDCPVTVDHSISSPVYFKAAVQDSHSSQDFLCVGYVFNQQGNVVTFTSNITATGTGAKTLIGSVSVTPSADYTYLLECEVPALSSSGSVSGIKVIKIL